VSPGAGCWAPGIAWDSENAAAFVGPRHGAWPYGACPIASNNGLVLDTAANLVMTDPPIGMYTYEQHWNQAQSGSLPANSLVQNPNFVSLTVNSGQLPTLTVPTPTCGTPIVRDRALITLDMWVGSRSNIQILLPAGVAGGANYEAEVENGVLAPSPSIGTVGNVGSLGGSGTVQNCSWSDEPYGVSSLDQTGAPNGLLGSVAMSYTASPVASVYHVGGPSIDSGQPYTMAVWVKPISYPASGNWHQFVFMSGTNTPLIYGQISSSGGLRYLRAAADSGATTYDGWDDSATANLIPLNVWSLVLLYCDGTNVSYQVYPAGGTMSSRPNKAITIGTYAGTHNWGIGGLGTQPSVNGYVSNPILFTRVLTASEVTQIMATPYTIPGLSSIHFRLNDAVKRRRAVRTWTRPYANSSLTRQLLVKLFSGGANATVINSWSINLQGLALSPNVG